MVRKIKETIQNKLNNICYDKYLDEIDRQDDVYKQWYTKEEGWKNQRYDALPDDIIIFADAKGVVEEKAAGVVAGFFKEHPYVKIAYGDEDCLDEAGKRYMPWFKPCWSPDTLDSFQYFGHFFAVKKELLSAILEEEWKPCQSDCDSLLCHKLLKKLTKHVTDEKWIGAADTQKAIASIGKVLIHMMQETSVCEDCATDSEGEKKVRENSVEQAPALISIVIPSKDNPEVLRTCISGICEKTETGYGNQKIISYEILVVDNGSNEENRKKIEEMSLQYGFSYHYQPMPFNFSAMCNLGVERAKGSYILLLNDDMEFIQPDWLLKLYEKACLPHVGAVGAKLLFPGSDIIQHIGITNITVGPVHKLLKQHDEKSHYHGQNRHIYDMIGVTAACLLVSREKYREAGNLFEGMAVAYNDVDFCFTLHELGYYNVLRNDVVLYHHESLSRGDDNLSDEKWQRLLEEKDILYNRHPLLKGKDPFYSENLAGHSNLFLPNYIYEFEKRDMHIKIRQWKGKNPQIWENGCLIVNVEHAREEKKLELKGQSDVYWIEGWSYVLGMDNCRYQRRLLLHGTKGITYEVQVLTRYRKDVGEILSQQKNVELAGYVCRIPKGALPGDTYTIAMLAKDSCSNQRLYCKTEEQIEIEE